MPKTIKDESGADVEVYEKTEYEAASAKVKELEEKTKQLEQETNPNWREARQKMSILEKERDEWKEKASKAGVKDDRVLDATEIERIAEAKTQQTLLTSYKNQMLSKYGDKREAVEAYFNKLASGEKLDEAKIEQFVGDAARAVGVGVRQRDTGAMFGRGGSAPEFPGSPNNPLPEDGFGASTQGKSTAAAMGLVIDMPKKQ
jgi:hypothetical protein